MNGASMSAHNGRNTLADELQRRGHIRTSSVESAFRTVPRHLFVPEVAPDQAYRDEVVPITVPGKANASSASQPAIVAQMLEQLELSPGQRVLEIGTASGYNAALMAHIVDEEGQVVTVEIEGTLTQRARERLDAAGFGRVEVVHADGGLGYPDEAPYDRIIVTAGSWDIAPAWREQLNSSGRLTLPLEVWPSLQVCVAFKPEKDASGDHLASVAAQWCGFLRLRGEFAGPESGPGEPEVELPIEERLRVLRDESQASGRPFPEWLRIRAYPRGSGYIPSPEELVVEKRWSRLIFDW